jgi:predicted aldo/keto reductase-like oxidoreductase
MPGTAPNSTSRSKRRAGKELVLRTATLGHTGLEVVRLGCGGIPIINVPFDDAVAVVRAALDAGVNYFDNARAYGDSEAKMGTALEGRRDEVILATKTVTRDAAGAMADLETSLAALCTDHLDIWQLHDVSTVGDYERVTAPGGALEAAKQARQQGKTRFIGMSSHNPESLRRAIESGEFDTVLLTYNIGTIWTEPLMAEAQKRDIGVVVMKPMSGGVFFTLSKEQEESLPSITPEETLRFVLLNEDVDVALSGFRRVEEVPQNLAVLNDLKPLTAGQRARLLKFGEDLGLVYCRRCTYCMPCTVGIDIPSVLAILDHSERFSYEWPSHRRRYAELEVKPTECEECGECEERCPFDVPIMERLKAAAKKFDRPY